MGAGARARAIQRGRSAGPRLPLLQASPDGLLLQSSTVADRVSYCFCGGETALVPGAYIEFAERLVLPQFEGLQVGRGRG